MMHITCQDTLCIYEQDGKCLLDRISLDNRATCEACIEVEMGQAQRDAEKRRLRAQLGEGWVEQMRK
nr:hypothetical protein [Maliibacterium massiliense]